MKPILRSFGWIAEAGQKSPFDQILVPVKKYTSQRKNQQLLMKEKNSCRIYVITGETVLL